MGAYRRDDVDGPFAYTRIFCAKTIDESRHHLIVCNRHLLGLVQCKQLNFRDSRFEALLHNGIEAHAPQHLKGQRTQDHSESTRNGLIGHIGVV